MNVKKILKQMQGYAEQIEQNQKELLTKTYEGKAGGELVKIEINGLATILSVKIDDSIMKVEDKELVQDLLVNAFADAKRKLDGDSSSMNEMLNMMPTGFKMPF